MSISPGDTDVGPLFPLWVWDLVCPAFEDGVAIQENGLITLVNDRFAGLIRHPPDRLIGRSVALLIAPGDWDRLGEADTNGDRAGVVRMIGADGAAVAVRLAMRSTDLGTGTVDVLCLSDRVRGLPEALSRPAEIGHAPVDLGPVPMADPADPPPATAGTTIAELIEPILPLARLIGRTRRITLTAGAIEPDGVVEAGRDQMRRAILDALALAVEAASCGGELRLSAAVTEGRLVVRIADPAVAVCPAAPGCPGVGVCPAAGEGGCVLRGGGRSLGLTRRIVEHHGGRVAIGRDPERGAIVEIALPARRLREPPA